MTEMTVTVLKLCSRRAHDRGATMIPVTVASCSTNSPTAVTAGPRHNFVVVKGHPGLGPGEGGAESHEG